MKGFRTVDVAPVGAVNALKLLLITTEEAMEGIGF
jgi:hypothetical protein